MTAALRNLAWSSLVVLIALAVLRPSGAMAQAADNEAEAKRLYDEGFRLGREEGHWCEAIDPFTKSQALHPTAKTLGNTGVAQEKCGKLMEARQSFSNFLDQYGNSPDGQSMLERVKGYMDSLDQRIPRIKLNATGLLPTDQLQLDGEAVDARLVSDYIAVNPGKHTVSVMRNTGVATKEEFTIQERENRVIEFSVPPPCADADNDGKCDETCVDRNLDGKCDKDQCKDWDDSKEICLDGTGAGDSEDGGMLSKPLFWVVAGTVVAAALVVGGILIFSGGGDSPSPTGDDFGGPFKPVGGGATALTSF